MIRLFRGAGSVGVALMLTASLAGCLGLPGGSGGPEPDPRPTETEATVVEAALGVPIRVEQADGVGELTITNPTFSTDAPGGLPFEPAGDHGYLIMDASWSTLEGTTSMVAYYWMVRDAAGVDGAHHLFLDESFSGLDLKEGDTITGQIGFEIAPGPYTFIVFNDEIDEVARFTFEAAPRESDGVRS